MFVKMELSRLVINEGVEEQGILLREVDGDRQLAIRIGIFEALALDFVLKGRPGPRPLTHSLLQSCAQALGGELSKVAIHTVEDGTFFASIFLRSPRGIVEVDARPSDALTWAQLAGAPVFVESAVFEQSPDPQIPWD